MSQIPSISSKEPLVILDNYPVDGSSLTRSHKSRLKTLAAHVAVTMRRKVRVLGLNIYVVGHTDTTGSEAYNDDLGERRANQVVIHLKFLFKGKGLDGDNNETSKPKVRSNRFQPYVVFSLESEGELIPVADNENVKGRGNNRRVELSLEWVEQRKPRESMRKKLKQNKPERQVPIREKFVRECWDAEKYLMSRQLLKEAIVIYHSTRLQYENDEIFLIKRKLPTFGNLLVEKIFDEFNGKYGVGRIKNGVQKWIDGKSKTSNALVGKVFAIIGHVQQLKSIKSHFENDRLMGGVGAKADAARDELHKRLSCAAVRGEDLGTGRFWVGIRKSWDELDRLQSLCNTARQAKHKGIKSEPSFRNPPSFLNRGTDKKGL